MNKKCSSTYKTAALLDSLSAHIAIIDNEGIIIDTNKAWKSFDGNGATIKRSDPGTNYLKMLQHAVEQGNDYALKLTLGVQKVLQGDKESFSLTYPLQTETRTLWFNLTVRPYDQEGTQFIMVNEDITSTVQANIQSKESENRYQIQFEQSLDGILITDSEGQIIDANPAASDILGWKQEDLIGRTDNELMDENDFNYQDAIHKRKETGSFMLEVDLIHQNGSRIPAEISSRLFRNNNGKLQSIITLRDISRRIQVEQDLIKTKHFAETALESIPGAFFVLNNQGEFVRWNNNMVTRLGYSAEELAGKDMVDFIVEDYHQAAIEQFQDCLEGEELSIETKIYNKDGEIRDYFIGAKSFIEDGEKYVVGAALDMTNEKNIERENRRNQIMLEQLFENAPIGITIVDADNNIQQVNKSFENIFNYSQQEAVGENINQLIVPDNKTDEAKDISANTRKGQSLQTESIRMTKDKQEVSVLVGGIPVEFQDEVIAIYGMYVDITEQAEYQQKIEQALREKETLLAELHHRVKNNLALVNSLLELQLFESEDPELKQSLSEVKKRIMTIASTHEVLYQNGNFNNIPISKFIQELIESGAYHNGDRHDKITINTDGDDFDLDIDQSIPCGLLLNELLSLVFNFIDKDREIDLNIRMRKNGSKVHLILEGNDIINNPEEMQADQSLHHILIETLVMQLEGELLWPNSEERFQTFEFIFQKENGQRPAQKMLAKNIF